MLPNPAIIQKYLYIEKTPTWKVRAVHLFGIASWILVGYTYVLSTHLDPFYTYFVTPIITFVVMYHYISLGVNVFYKQHNLKQHLRKVEQFWKTYRAPSVDVFLPICGESIEVLENTWKHVAQLSYENKKVYVLDDSKEGCEEHRRLAETLGFTYIERPNKGEMEKAGNLKYTFERSSGEFIMIFDADFAPHPDFIVEALPYMEDPKVGIVQTPQYYEVSDRSYKHSSIAYNEAYSEEPFYRFIQVSRSRLGGALCCGSNAVYRRSILTSIGGPSQIAHSEDAHTGFEITIHGYKVFYLPVVLAIGLSPDNYYAFFHQQHRWCTGSMSLMLSKRFWWAPVSRSIKLCYITGFMFYLYHPLMLLLSFHLFWTLFLYNDYIPLGRNLAFYPHIIFGITYLWIFPIAKPRLSYFSVLIGRTYAYSHAVKTAFLRKSVGWVSTNAKHTSVSQAFSQSTTYVGIYALCYYVLILLGLRAGYIHLFDSGYWSIQFWMFWNFLLSVVLLWKLTTTKNQMSNQLSRFGYAPVGHIALFSAAFLLILGNPSVAAVQSLSVQPELHEAVQSVVEVSTDVTVASALAAEVETSTPSATPKVKSAAPRTIKKEYGGWYWQKELGRSQRWLGTDTTGNDIWTDTAQ